MPYECSNIKCGFTTSNVELYKEHQKICVFNTGIKSDDNINPSYYNGRDVMNIINKYNLSFCLGNVVKYVLRSKEKGGKKDLEKAMWYLKEEISKFNDKA
jgi:hypothetical protein